MTSMIDISLIMNRAFNILKVHSPDGTINAALILSMIISDCQWDCGVATVGHGWARAHPTSARVGREICTNSKSFLEE